MKNVAKGITSLVIKTIIIVSSLIGTYFCLKGFGNTFEKQARGFLYFTIESNIWISITLLVEIFLMIFKRKLSQVFYVFKLVFTVSITLTGIIFWTVLVFGSLNIPNIITHGVVPILSVVDYFLVGDQIHLKKRHVVFTSIPPLFYFALCGFGYAFHWNYGWGANYPYFFMNWGSEAGAIGFSKKLPYAGVLWWILLIGIIVIGSGLLYIVIVNKINNRKIKKK